jgi:hypothetical protein
VDAFSANNTTRPGPVRVISVSYRTVLYFWWCGSQTDITEVEHKQAPWLKEDTTNKQHGLIEFTLAEVPA